MTQAAIDLGSRTAVLLAAAEEFADHGYAAATLRGMAARCGMSTGAIFHYFGGKRELLMATMEYGTREVHDAAVEAIADRSDPRDRLVGLVAAHLACLHGTLRPYLVVVMNEFTRLYEVERRVLVSLRDGYETVWRTVLDDVAREGAGPTDPMLRLFLLGAVNHTYWWYDPDAGLDLATLADRLVGVVLPTTPRQHSGGIA